MRRIIQQTLIILFGSSAIGLLVNAVSPRGIPYTRPPQAQVAPQDVISLQDAQGAWSTGAAVFLDARAPADYIAGHIAGALNLPTEDFDQRYPLIEPLLGPDQPIIIYCDGKLCDLSHDLAEKLKAIGRIDVKILLNGWTVWKKAGQPINTGSKP